MQNNTQPSWEEEFQKIMSPKWAMCLECCDYESMHNELKSFIRSLLAKQAEEIEEAVGEKYNELIMAVASKYPNETRHETALRYIKNAENLVLALIKSTQV